MIANVSVCLSVRLSTCLIFSSTFQLSFYNVITDDTPTTCSTLMDLIGRNIPYHQAIFSHIIHPPHGTIIPYHKHTISHTVIFPCTVAHPPNKPYHHIPYQHRRSHTVPHHAPCHTVPYRTTPTLYLHHRRGSTIPGHDKIMPNVKDNAVEPRGSTIRAQLCSRKAYIEPPYNPNP